MTTSGENVAMERPSITPEMVNRFAAYFDANPAWGSLHIVLDDGNIENGHVEFCIGWADEHGDAEGAALARILLSLTKSQRGRVGRRAETAPSDRRPSDG